MAAHVADQVDADLTLHEAPPSSTALEAVVVPTAGDGLQRQVGQRLQVLDGSAALRGIGGHADGCGHGLPKAKTGDLRRRTIHDGRRSDLRRVSRSDNRAANGRL
ncbi:hypothetical protein ACH4YO_01590 [Streptomyces noursei]|uniref:hypothetical protein n=1 Tax=Streptomyces noursei TaxID=1971 RepID=UPI0033F11CB6